jgi:hypothetical protein
MPEVERSGRALSVKRDIVANRLEDIRSGIVDPKLTKEYQGRAVVAL